MEPIKKSTYTFCDINSQIDAIIVMGQNFFPKTMET